MKKDFKDGVSVIIPTFNRAKYLYSTLICLCNQYIDLDIDYEIIIIDSGNDEETKSIVDYFINTDNLFIRYYKVKKSKNRSYVRNYGASKAIYEILCFLDNDILVPSNFINTIYYEQKKSE